MSKPEEEEEMWTEEGDEPSNPNEVLAICMQNFAKQVVYKKNCFSAFRS